MSQIFTLTLAPDTIKADARQLGVTIDDLLAIKVEVVATLINAADSIQAPDWQLQLHYSVTLPLKSLALQLDWAIWHPKNVGFVDYLWEQTCLECFLAGGLMSDAISLTANVNKSTAYIEINANPDGRYALYQFADYRNPSALPPTPLLQADKQARAFINWPADDNQDARVEQKTAIEQYSSSIDSEIGNPPSVKTYHYERCVHLPLSPLFTIKTSDEIDIKYLHPCVILSFDTALGIMALYFAPKHASPPDFHNLQYWSVFDTQAAMTKDAFSH